MKDLSLILVAAIAFTLVSRPQASAADELKASPAGRTTAWQLKFKDQPVMVYSYEPQQYKPCVKELYTLKGENVLRDSPADHLHHHALMYAIKVNGVNFWEELPGAGVQKTVKISAPEIAKSPAGLPQATLTQVLHWVEAQDAFLPDTNALTLLIERRTLVLTVDEANDEVALQWKSHFQVGTKTNTVVLTGANYHGLGMRFVQELDAGAAHFTEQGPLDLTGTMQDVSAHAWEAVGFNAPGKAATIALYGHPSNARGNSRYFAMHQPFAYLSATQNLDQEPLVYRKGEEFELNYLVVLYPGAKAAPQLSNRGESWRQAKP